MAGELDAVGPIGLVMRRDRRSPATRQWRALLAELGGFLGRKGDGEPGTQTVRLGLPRLDDLAARTTYTVSSNRTYRSSSGLKPDANEKGKKPSCAPDSRPGRLALVPCTFP